MWINIETEDIAKTRIFTDLISKYNLKVAFEKSLDYRFLNFYNQNVLFKIYIERGFLQLDIYDFKKNRWLANFVNHYVPNNDMELKKIFYYNQIDFINTVEVFNVEVTKDLYYQINFMDIYLNELFAGEFTKIEKYMAPMKESQIEEIRNFLALNK